MRQTARGAAVEAGGCSLGHPEEGASPVTSIVGLGVFLTFLVFVVQVVLYLFTSSVVQAAAVDGASRGAGAASSDSALAAREHAEAILGDLADDAVITTAITTDKSGELLNVGIEVRVPTLLGRVGLATVERGAEARIEQ